MRKLFLLYLLSISSVVGAVELKISGGPGYPLIHAGTGKKNFTISYTLDQPFHEIGLSVVLKNYENGKVIDKHYQNIKNPVSSNITFPLNIPGYGFFTYEVSLTDTGNKREIASETTCVAVVPERKQTGPADFGVCTHFAQNKGLIPYSLDLIQLAGFSSIRDEIYWGSLEKTPGVFRFEPKYDQYIDAAYRKGLSVMLLLGYGNPNGEPVVERGFPVDETGRKRFVRYTEEVVSRYKDKVSYWELWNEPSIASGIIPGKVYLPLLEDVYRTIKAIRPDAGVVCSGGAPNHVDGAFVKPIFEAGGASSMDGFAMHTYVCPHTPEDGYPAVGSPVFKRVSVPGLWSLYGDLLHRFSSGHSLSAWVTEVGWHLMNDTVKGVEIDELRQAAYITRLYLLSRRYNTVETTYLYDFQNDGTSLSEREDNFGVITIDFAPKAAYPAVGMLTYLLSDKPFLEALVDTDTVKAYKYGTKDDFVVAAWYVNRHDEPLADRKDREITLDLGVKKVAGFDWQGTKKEYRSKDGKVVISINENPTYLISKK